MPIVYDLETDIRYIQGMNKGEARGEARGVEQTINASIKKQLLMKILTNQQIADSLDVPIERVEKIKKTLWISLKK